MAEIVGHFVVIRNNGKDGSAKLTWESCIPQMTIGRAEGCEIRVQLPTVSRKQAELKMNKETGIVSLVDYSKVNHTMLDKEIVPNQLEVVVPHKGIITVGDRNFRFEYAMGKTPEGVAALEEHFRNEHAKKFETVDQENMHPNESTRPAASSKNEKADDADATQDLSKFVRGPRKRVIKRMNKPLATVPECNSSAPTPKDKMKRIKEASNNRLETTQNTKKTVVDGESQNVPPEVTATSDSLPSTVTTPQKSISEISKGSRDRRTPRQGALTPLQKSIALTAALRSAASVSCQSVEKEEKMKCCNESPLALKAATTNAVRVSETERSGLNVDLNASTFSTENIKEDVVMSDQISPPLKKCLFSEENMNRPENPLKKCIQTPMKNELVNSVSELTIRRGRASVPVPMGSAIKAGIKKSAVNNAMNKEKRMCKKMSTPQKKIIQDAASILKSQMVDHTKLRCLTTPLKKDVLTESISRAGKRTGKVPAVPLRTPLKKAIFITSALMAANRPPNQSSTKINSVIKKSIKQVAQNYAESRTDAPSKKVGTPLKKELSQVVAYHASQTVKVSDLKINTPLKHEVVSSAISRATRLSLRDSKKILKTPLKTEIAKSATEFTLRSAKSQNLLIIDSNIDSSSTKEQGDVKACEESSEDHEFSNEKKEVVVQEVIETLSTPNVESCMKNISSLDDVKGGKKLLDEEHTNKDTLNVSVSPFLRRTIIRSRNIQKLRNRQSKRQKMSSTKKVVDISAALRKHSQKVSQSTTIKSTPVVVMVSTVKETDIFDSEERNTSLSSKHSDNSKKLNTPLRESLVEKATLCVEKRGHQGLKKAIQTPLKKELKLSVAEFHASRGNSEACKSLDTPVKFEIATKALEYANVREQKEVSNVSLPTPMKKELKESAEQVVASRHELALDSVLGSAIKANIKEIEYAGSIANIPTSKIGSHLKNEIVHAANLHTSQKACSGELKKLQTPLKKALSRDASKRIAERKGKILKRALQSPMQKEVKLSAQEMNTNRANFEDFKKMDTPLKRAVVAQSSHCAKMRDQITMDSSLATPMKKEIFTSAGEIAAIRRGQAPMAALGSTIKANIHQLATKHSENRVNFPPDTKITSPLKQDIAQSALLCSSRRSTRGSLKRLHTPLKRDVIVEASSRVEEREHKRLKKACETPMRNELKLSANEMNKKHINCKRIKSLDTPIKRDVLTRATQCANMREQNAHDVAILGTLMKKEIIKSAEELCASRCDFPPEEKMNSLMKKNIAQAVLAHTSHQYSRGSLRTIKTPLKRGVITEATNLAEDRGQRIIKKVVHTPMRNELKLFVHDKNAGRSTVELVSQIDESLKSDILKEAVKREESRDRRSSRKLGTPLKLSIKEKASSLLFLKGDMSSVRKLDTPFKKAIFSAANARIEREILEARQIENEEVENTETTVPCSENNRCAEDKEEQKGEELAQPEFSHTTINAKVEVEEPCVIQQEESNAAVDIIERDTKLDEPDFSCMTVGSLREECTKYGLESNGRKAEIIERLECHIQEKNEPEYHTTEELTEGGAVSVGAPEEGNSGFDVKIDHLTRLPKEQDECSSLCFRPPLPPFTPRSLVKKKVADLREECVKFGIESTGKKAVLVQRLEEFSSRSSIKVHLDDEHRFRRSVTEDPTLRIDTMLSTRLDKIADTDFRSMKVVALRAECKKRKIDVSGLKAELITRLETHTNTAAVGTPSPLSKRLSESTQLENNENLVQNPPKRRKQADDQTLNVDFKSMTVVMLRDECKKRGLSSVGRKTELIDRLGTFENENSIQ